MINAHAHPVLSDQRGSKGGNFWDNDGDHNYHEGDNDNDADADENDEHANYNDDDMRINVSFPCYYIRLERIRREYFWQL